MRELAFRWLNSLAHFLRRKFGDHVTFVQPRVILIARTHLTTLSDVDRLTFATDEWLPLESEVASSDHLAEFAGRGCYEAWSRSNPKTATNLAYLDHIIDVGHTSLFAHAAASFYVTGVSRSLTHELVRHRFLVFSQRSQRFVDESDCDFVCPPLLDNPEHADLREVLYREVLLARRAYGQLAEALIERGVSRKQAREAARAVLPEATETRLTVSGNLRAWRDFIKLRTGEGADAEIQRFAALVLQEIREKVAPASVQDL